MGTGLFFRIASTISPTQNTRQQVSYTPRDTNQKGMEAFLNSALSDTIRYQMSYSYLDAKVSDSSRDGIYFGSDIGSQLIRRPMPQVAPCRLLGFKYTVYTECSVMAVANREDPSGVRFEDFGLLRICADHALTDRCELYVRLENVLDEDYQWTAGYSGAPRSIALGVNWSF